MEGALQQFVSMQLEMWSGPFPPAAALERYAELFPDAPKIIFTTFQKQAEHRIAIEDFSVRANAKRSTEGLRLGFAISVLVFLICAFLIYNGHAVSAAVLGAVNVAALAGVFVYGSRGQRQERERKHEDMVQAASGRMRSPNQAREGTPPQKGPAAD